MHNSTIFLTIFFIVFYIADDFTATLDIHFNFSHDIQLKNS